MPAKRTPARRTTPARRRTTTSRTRAKHPARRVKIPRGGPLPARIGTWFVLRVVTPAVTTHSDVVRSRKDAAIMKLTHEGCATCNGLGQIHTRNKKTGELTGSKSCPAKPTKQRASKWAVYKASRFGADKNTGLIGWSCPCGKKAKPRYRDAREATKALRAHEKANHGGQTVGGAWYAQTNGATTPTEQPAKTAQPPQTKVVANSGMSDEQWIKQNKPIKPATAIAKGLCWQCAGNRALYSAFGGQQTVVVCGECQGTGKAPKAA